MAPTAKIKFADFVIERKADVSKEKNSISSQLKTGNHSIRGISRLQGVSHYTVIQLFRKMKDNLSVTSSNR